MSRGKAKTFYLNLKKILKYQIWWSDELGWGIRTY